VKKTAAAMLLLVASLAKAQLGTITGPPFGALSCAEAGASIPELRPESYTELAGDIVITCSGGPPSTVGAAIPAANIVLFIEPEVPITSRFLAPNGASEVILLIDEPGSGITTGATGGYGPQAPQTLCTTAQQQSHANPCQAVVGSDGSGQYEVAVLPGTSTPAPNVFQGKIGDFGANSVVFYNVPVLPPAYQGLTRVFRITNLRIPVAAGAIIFQVQGLISTSPSTVMPINTQPISLGVVAPATTASVNAAPAGGGNPFQACVPRSNPALAAQITFTEGFATAFKTRVVPGGMANTLANTPVGSNPNYVYAAEAQNLTAPFNQNLPGGVYGGIANNSESGFIAAEASKTVLGLTYYAGLMDYGTRLKAVFTNIPAGVTVWVSTANAASYTRPGGLSLAPYAVLVAASQIQEATSDGATFTPLAAAGTGSDGLPAYPIVPDASGKAAAVWEVLNADPAAQDVFTFSVYVAYASTAGTASPTNVALSFAPDPGGGTFSAANETQGLTSPSPRFAVLSAQGGAWATIDACTVTTSGAGTACGLTTDAAPTVTQVQSMIDQVLGIAPPTYDLNYDGVVNVADIAMVIGAAMAGRCVI
jgi:hypothetical protein